MPELAYGAPSKGVGRMTLWVRIPPGPRSECTQPPRGSEWILTDSVLFNLSYYPSKQYQLQNLVVESGKLADIAKITLGILQNYGSVAQLVRAFDR